MGKIVKKTSNTINTPGTRNSSKKEAKRSKDNI